MPLLLQFEVLVVLQGFPVASPHKTAFGKEFVSQVVASYHVWERLLAVAVTHSIGGPYKASAVTPNLAIWVVERIDVDS